MDLDDIFKVFIHKSKRKKLKKEVKKQVKKQVKKRSLTSFVKGILTTIFAIFFGRKSSQTAHPPAAQSSPIAPQPRTTNNKPTPFAAELAQAHRYRTQIEALARSAPADSIAHTRLTIFTDRIDDWVTHIEEIVRRTNAYQDDPLLTADRKQVPEAIKRLEKQLEEAKDPTLRQKLERTLENRRKQLAQLQQTANQQQLTALKVENTLAQLGLIYSQLHSSSFTAEQGGYERLTAEIEEEIHTLDDYLATLQALQEPPTTWS